MKEVDPKITQEEVEYLFLQVVKCTVVVAVRHERVMYTYSRAVRALPLLQIAREFTRGRSF